MRGFRSTGLRSGLLILLYIYIVGAYFTAWGFNLQDRVNVLCFLFFYRRIGNFFSWFVFFVFSSRKLIAVSGRERLLVGTTEYFSQNAGERDLEVVVGHHVDEGVQR